MGAGKAKAPNAHSNDDYERFQVLTLREGKIIDMQGCETRRQAERFARRKRD